MALQTDTIQVTGVRCERCVMRLGSSLQGLDLPDQAEEQLEIGRSQGVESLCRRLVDLT